MLLSWEKRSTICWKEKLFRIGPVKGLHHYKLWVKHRRTYFIYFPLCHIYFRIFNVWPSIFTYITAAKLLNMEMHAIRVLTLNIIMVLSLNICVLNEFSGTTWDTQLIHKLNYTSMIKSLSTLECIHTHRVILDLLGTVTDVAILLVFVKLRCH